MIVIHCRMIRILLVILFFSPLFAPAQHKTSEKVNETNLVDEQRFISVNGIEHWMTIKGNASKPAILFLHGGPGSPMSPYADTIFAKWKNDFLFIQWDQRGTGRTFGKTAPEELTPSFLQSNLLTVDQMVNDGIRLTEYLLKYLSKQKLILFGTSWGSVPGTRMVAERPELFYAYIGHAQVTDPSDDSALYQKVYTMAVKAGDTRSQAMLDEIGKPPYTQAKKMGTLLRVVKKYERENAVAPPAHWFALAAAYDNATDNLHRENGDDYSFVNYMGDAGLNIPSMRATINFPKQHLHFKVPVYFIQGSEDLLTDPGSTRNYFDKIRAPHKQYFLLPATAHGFNEAVVDTLFRICKQIKTQE